MGLVFQRDMIPVSWSYDGIISLEERRDLLDGPVLGLWHDDLDVDDEDDLDDDEDDEDVGVHRQLQGKGEVFRKMGIAFIDSNVLLSKSYF